MQESGAEDSRQPTNIRYDPQKFGCMTTADSELPTNKLQVRVSLQTEVCSLRVSDTVEIWF